MQHRVPALPTQSSETYFVLSQAVRSAVAWVSGALRWQLFNANLNTVAILILSQPHLDFKYHLAIES